MAVGLQVRRPSDGAVLINSDTRLTIFIGTVDTVANQAGSISHPVFAQGNAFVCMTYNATVTRDSTLPEVNFSGSTMSWTSATVPATIMYGIYA